MFGSYDELVGEAFDKALISLSDDLKNLLLMKLANDYDIYLDESTIDKYIDPNDRYHSKLLREAIIKASENVILPIILNSVTKYKSQDNIIDRLKPYKNKQVKFFIDGKEVFPTGAWYSYRGDYKKLGIEYTEEPNEEIVDWNDLPFEGEVFEGYKGGRFFINAMSEFTLTKSDSYYEPLIFDKMEIERKSGNTTFKFYFKKENR